MQRGNRKAATTMRSVELLVSYGADTVMPAVLSVLENEFSLPTTVTSVNHASMTDAAAALVDDFFNWMNQLRPQVQSMLVFLVPARLETSFGYEVVAETRASRIIIATPKLTPKTLPRVLRHEIGRVMGLEDHWGCVMSRYYVENPTFCIHCRAALLQSGIAWRTDTSQDRKQHGQADADEV
ncbi:MAG TPA: hypothetical protein VGR02_18830 [Thermoanaerobaculia bacterium]|jgi:hypothetical protein|nr:hypothetical protein [Thermoanaerobaculia bacterium]